MMKMMNSLILVLALMGGMTATAERDGKNIVVTTSVDEGHLSDVEIISARGKEQIAELPDGKWTYESPYDSGVVHGKNCTDDFCEPVETAFAVPSTFSGFLYIMGLAVAAGFLMNFMPCVLPVLGLKLVAAVKGGGKGWYVLGVLFSFALLATGAVVLGTGLSHMAQPWFRVILSLVCMLMGLHFLGLWHLPYVSLGKWGNRGGSFGIGVTTVALGSSCSVPFLAPILVYAANHVWYETYLLFMSVGLGFASPFILPVYKLLPKPGNWMVWMERTCGIALLTAAGWLALTLVNGPLIGFLWLSFWSIVLIFQRDPWKTNVVSIVLAIVILWGMVATYNLVFPQQSAIPLNLTKTPGIVFVTADWCVNCPIAHAVVDSDEVTKALAAIQGRLVVLDWTNGDAATTAFMVQYGVKPAVPFALVVDSNLKETVLSGIFTKQQVIEALNIQGQSKADYTNP